MKNVTMNVPGFPDGSFLKNHPNGSFSASRHLTGGAILALDIPPNQTAHTAFVNEVADDAPEPSKEPVPVATANVKSLAADVMAARKARDSKAFLTTLDSLLSELGAPGLQELEDAEEQPAPSNPAPAPESSAPSQTPEEQDAADEKAGADLAADVNAVLPDIASFAFKKGFSAVRQAQADAAAADYQKGIDLVNAKQPLPDNASQSMKDGMNYQMEFQAGLALATDGQTLPTDASAAAKAGFDSYKAPEPTPQAEGTTDTPAPQVEEAPAAPAADAPAPSQP